MSEPLAPPRKPKGFAAMSPERRREIASKGGRALKPEKRAFSKSHDLAVAAGRKGGSSVDPKNRAFARDNELAQSAGKKGGNAMRKGGK